MVHSDKKLVLQRADLPADFTPDPRGERIAWSDPRRVCVAPVAEPGHSACAPLPER